MSAYWMDREHFGRPVASFLLGPGINLPIDHRFDNGTQVLVTQFDPLKEEPQRGSVVGSTQSQLRVSFPEPFDLDGGPWRLDVGRSNIVYDRMRTAIAQLNYDPAIQDNISGHHCSDREIILQGTYLRDVILRSFSPSEEQESEVDKAYIPVERSRVGKAPLSLEGAFKHDMLIQSWAKRFSRPDPIVVEGDPPLDGLNATQKRAVAMMLNNKFTLVQGPPGTGKTKTIIEAVKLLKMHFEVPHPILLCTYTNVAVDNLVEGLLSADLKPIRIGSGGKIKPSLQECSLEAKLCQHSLYPKYEETQASINAVRKRKRALEEKIAAARLSHKSSHLRRLEAMEMDAIMMERQTAALLAKLYAIYRQMLRDVLLAADVICTTCISSASATFDVIDFPIVFIDEASMSTEPASLIPLMKGSQHVSLIGDHKQLPPVITSPEAQAKGLGVSLFERLSEEGELPSIMLDIQYRMHPTISHFPSAEFYNSTLRDGTLDALGNISPGLLPPNFSVIPTDPNPTNRPSVIFLDHMGAESVKDRSRVNWNEAHIVCGLIEDLLINNPQLQGNDIGIIAPYAAQISLLSRLLDTDVAFKKRFETTLGSHRAMQVPRIEVKTVDGFEGREKDIIIFSTVRNNASGHIGFLADRRRLNVGLTRAKRGLIVVGSISTLRMGKTASVNPVIKVGKGGEAWRRYTQFLNDQKLVLQLNGPQLRKVLYGNHPDGPVLRLEF